MPKRTYRKKSGKKGSKKSYRKKGSKKSYRKKGSKKGSKKSKRRLSRFKVDPSNRCTTNKKAQCLTDPNCTYVKKRGCRSRQGTISDNLVFEGPMGPPAGYVPSMRIKKRKGSKKSRKGSKKSYRKKGSKKSYRKKGSKKSRKGSKKSRGKKYSKRR